MTEEINLNGTWELTAPELPGKTIPAELPGDFYTALIRAGICPDPFYADNEKRVQQFASYHWCCRRTFTVPERLLEAERIILSLTMADTFVTVKLNGKKVLDSSNMFARREASIKSMLRPGKNTAELLFSPIGEESAKIAKKIGEEIPQVGVCPTPRMNLIRKAHCHGGWDWGISLPVSGVYEPIRLTGCGAARVDHLSTVQRFSADGKVSVTAEAVVQSFRKGPQTITFRFNGEEKQIRTVLPCGRSKAICRFEVKKPDLWWPRGYGKQPLYPLEAECCGSSAAIRVGLRKLEVISKPDAYGKSFVIRVNGTDVFVKGANWIPCSALPSAQTPEHYRTLLESAAAANMNALRVWGGGQYEKDLFYDLCDELGLLIWHDMMFSCSIYPATEEFLAQVKEELEYQLPRLRHHACIALWCGDNELVGAASWYSNGDPERRTRFLIMHDRLNKVEEDAVRSLDPERIFWPSSPCGGPGDISDGWHNDSCGDMHYWSVWGEGKPFSAYYTKQPRFCSEFGYQSYPSLSTVRSFCPEEQRDVFSPVMDVHQKCPAGNSPIIAMFSQHFRMPARFEDFLYCSQVQQAIAIRTGIEYWRTLRPRCMGTIYWQLNDLWPVVSWSSIEYGGKWKLLHYQAKRSYADLLLTGHVTEEKTLVVDAVRDARSAAKLTGKLQIRSLSGKILKTIPLKASFDGAGSLRLCELPVSAFAAWENNAIFLHGTIRDGKETAENTFFLVPYKQCPLADPEIRMTVKAEKGGFALTLQCARPAFFVALDADALKGVFSDNCFTLLPDVPRTIHFAAAEKISPAEFQKKCTVKSLFWALFPKKVGTLNCACDRKRGSEA